MGLHARGALIANTPSPVHALRQALSDMETREAQAYIGTMTDSTDWAAATEARLLDAATPLVPELGWNARLVRRAGVPAQFGD